MRLLATSVVVLQFYLKIKSWAKSSSCLFQQELNASVSLLDT